MQLIAKGPDLPESLLLAHEEGRVVFFCGAGISYPAGLPDFGGLVTEIYERIGIDPTPIEQEALKRYQYDAALDLLERRIVGSRIAVRRALRSSLHPKLKNPGALDTHEALLTLSRSREGPLRLVTTNFDGVFDAAARRSNLRFSSYSAPMLPVPKNSRWDGLVYLHGRLPKRNDELGLHKLIVTSGDFGLAYLTERWAARFVSELFRNYVVCFVGYSINDPVLRYMMDALAADRMLGEFTPQAFAFGSTTPGKEEETTLEWKAKGVDPILYEVPLGTKDHSALHLTLKTWASTYRDGVLGIERIVLSHALARPSASTAQDNFVGRLVWAVGHPSGLPAKRFAEFDPVPSLEWLGAFADQRYRTKDLKKFGLIAIDEAPELKFSLIHRPAPYQYSPWMSLLGGGNASRWDVVLHQIGRWLIRHLNDPKLLIWFAENGGKLNESMRWLIESELERLARLKSKDPATPETDDPKPDAAAIAPSDLMQKLWWILLSGRVKSSSTSTDIYRWKSHLQLRGLTPSLRMELRELLAPRLRLKATTPWRDEEAASTEPMKLKQLVDWELELNADHVDSALEDLHDSSWRSHLSDLLPDFERLLLDALSMFEELGQADAKSDRSHWDLPSIETHWQNRRFRDWTYLIELTRDSWEVLRARDPEMAERVAITWFGFPYSTFKRLALYAAARSKNIQARVWVDWLLEDDRWWLWCIDTRREVIRLLVLKGPELRRPELARLEQAILDGPPRAMYREDLDTEGWNGILERTIWLPLAKLRAAGVKLGKQASLRLTEISNLHPRWEVASDERDEFSHWMSGTGDPDFEDMKVIEPAPRQRALLVEWLREGPNSDNPFHEDTWKDLCKTRFFLCLSALNHLSKAGVWPASRWREALQVWSEESLAERSWGFAAELILQMPDETLFDCSHAVSWWLERVAKVLKAHRDSFVLICRRILALDFDDDQLDDLPDRAVNEAINHPIGNVTEALLYLWFRSEPNDGDRLPTDIEPLFSLMCTRSSGAYRHARVVLASRLIALYRVDQSWTTTKLLPFFNWSPDHAGARAAWEGFLWSPRIYRPLFEAFWSDFVETSCYFIELGECSRNYASLLTFLALEPTGDWPPESAKQAMANLPASALVDVANALAQALQASGAQKKEFWKNRILSFWKDYWPKSQAMATPEVSDALVRLLAGSEDSFPAAIALLSPWLRPAAHADYPVHLLSNSDLPTKFPLESLELLSIIVSEEMFAPMQLMACLKRIAESSELVARDARYQRLVEYARRHGQ